MTDTSIPPDPEDADITNLFLGTVDDSSFGPVEFGPPEEVTDLPPEDITTDLPIEEPVKVGDGECVVCGAPTFRPPGLTKAGHRKRTPKYCDLHNPKLRVQKEGPFTSGVDGAAQLQRIQEELADDIRLLAVMAGPLLPVTGMYAWEIADPFTLALLKLCKNNQRALRILHRAATVAPIYEVAKDMAGIFYAIQVDLNRLEPHNTVSQRLGVERVYNNVYPETGDATVSSVATNGSMGPPRYATTQ